MGERGMDGNWREIKSSDGTFELTGIPPGRVRVRVRADGYIEPSNQTIDLAPSSTSDGVRHSTTDGCLGSTVSRMRQR